MSGKLKYIGRRLVYAALTVFILITVTFALMHMMPGDPFVGKKNIRPEVYAAVTEKYGLDKPVIEQYGIYLSNVFQGDLGDSLVSGRAVTDIIGKAFPVSLELGIRALVFALIIGFGLGILAAIKHGTAWDTGAMILALIGVSIPSFILGALLQYFLGTALYQATGVHVFAVIGWNGENSKILPAFALAFSAVAIISRLMRSSLIDVMNQDYIRTARMKGLSRAQVVLHHGVRNAVMPVITVLGPLVAVLFTGTFAIENVFSIPGLGKYFVDSIRANDYPVIIGTTLFFGVFLVLCNLAVDIINSAIDPRIRLDGR